MKADNSRNTFRPDRHYRDVVKQQGRVDVDADWNEQQAINVRRTESEAVDVIGRTGAPVHAPGFAITADGFTLRIGAGRYYVDGILCENERDGLDYIEQPDRRDIRGVVEDLRSADAGTGIVYLDVWLRHITAINDPLIREIALGGPDTATRTQVVWQVKVLPLATVRPDRERLARAQAQAAALQARLPALIARGVDISALIQELAEVNREIAVLAGASSNESVTCDSAVPAWDRLVAPAAGRLNARAAPTPPTTDLCELPPRAGYQRTENQLYRVEVHHGGEIGQATFKWSRDNGSVVTAIEDVNGLDVVVRNTGPDDVLGFAANQWVEMVDDATDLAGVPGQLLQIEHVPSGSRNVTMKTTPPATDRSLRPLLRRWDQSGPQSTADGITVTGGWQLLEDGVEVKFSSGPFRTGEYWVIPARVATGDVEWPPFEIPNRGPLPQPSDGIQHHFSRLALVRFNDEELRVTADCRKIFLPLTEIAAPPAQEAMHVKETSWQNDAPLGFGEFLGKGLSVDFDRLPDPISLSSKTVIVALELPIVPETGFEPVPTGREIAPRMTTILFGEVTVSENQVRWLPARSNFQSLASFLRGLRQVIGRVTLTGAAIWSKKQGRLVYLDGCARGEPADSASGAAPRTGLIFPSGSGERSSNFESWFLLTFPATLGGFALAPQNVRLLQTGNTFRFVAADTGAPVDVVGTITLSTAATTETVITLSAGENADMIDIPATITARPGELSARFLVGVGTRLPDGTVPVTITASAAGTELSTTLTIARR